MSRYVSTRRAGAWHVLDTTSGDVLESFAAGAAGAEAAASRAAALNRAQSASRQAPQESGAREALRAWRVAHGLTQAALAQRLDVTRLTVARWETGTRRVPAFLALALSSLETDLSDV